MTGDETGMEQASDLEALKRLHGLLRRRQAEDENLDETSRSLHRPLLMRMLDDALLREAKMLSGPPMSPALEKMLSIRPERRARDAEPWLGIKPPVSRSPSLLTSERSRWLKPQSSVRSRDAGHRVLGDRRGDDERLLGRVASYRSSRTAMSGNYLDTEQRLGSRRSSRPAEARRFTVDGGARRGERSGRPRRGGGSGRADNSSPEHSGRWRSVPGEPSTQGRARLHGRDTPRHAGVGAEGSSTRRFWRLDSGLSASIRTSRRGSRRAAAAAGGAATLKRSSSSSSNGTVTIRSRIKPSGELMERSLRRAEEEAGETLRRRRRKDGAAVASGSLGWSRRPRRPLNRINSMSTYSSGSSGAVSSSPHTSHAASLTSSASASSSSPVFRGRDVPPEYAFEAASTSGSRRRRERQERRLRLERERLRRRELLEKRVGRVRWLKNKFNLVLHHRHDHHHHHHVGRDRGTHHRMSPWRYLKGMLRRSTGYEGKKTTAGYDGKKTTSRTAVSTPAKRRHGGGGHMQAWVRHVWATTTRRRRAPKPAGMRRMVSRVQVKKLHWWQKMRRRRGRTNAAGSSRPRRSFGQRTLF